MIQKRWLSIALATALLAQAPLAQASSNPVCSGGDNKVDIVGGFGGELYSLETITTERITGWASEHKIQGVDPQHWAAPLLLALVGTGHIVLRDGEAVDLEAPVTVYYAAEVMMRRAKQPIDGLSPWEIAVRAAQLGLISGPVPAEDRPMTRLEAAFIAGFMTGFPGKVDQKVEMSRVWGDWESIPAESHDLIYWVTMENRLFTGFGDRSFRPYETFTRGQFMALQYRLRTWWPEPAPELIGG